jgi:hypothetical protein
MNTSQISTSAGERPNVDLNGEANPAQIQSTQTQSNQELQTAKAQAVADTNQDFGENSIFPKASNETLKANKELSTIAPPTMQGLEAPAVPGEAAGGLNQSLTPFLREKIGAEQEKYQSGKDKFDTDTVQARADADQEIAGLDEETKQKQIAEQEQAKAEVTQARQEWRTELDTVDQDYQEKASQASQEQRDKIDTEKLNGEEKAAQHLEDAEKEAEQEKQKADKEANKKKEEGEKESGGFLGWLKSKAKAFIDGIKQAVNTIFDNLRKAVKAIFEAAKNLAMQAIDLARKAIVGLIKGFGEILKGLVKVAFAAFPEIAKKINAKIDQAVKKAEQAVNAAADLLKKGIATVLDFLANALDAILAAYQAIYNAVFDAIGAVVNLLLDVMQKIGYLVTAASQMPDHFWGQMSEEVLGMDVTQPLAFERTPEDCAKCNVPTVAESASPATAEGGNDKLAAMLQKNEFTENDIAVDNVAPFDVNPELMASMNLQDGGEVEFGESNDPTNSMEAIKAELAGEAPEAGLESSPGEVSVGQSENATGCCDDEQTAQAKLEQMMTQPVEGATGTQKQSEPAKQGDIPASMKTIGPLTPWQRSQYMLHQMKQGIKQWFAANWGKLLAGAIAGITGFIALNIITGGAIMAAVPPFLQIMGTVMAGVAMAQIAGHVGSYFSQGWAGEIVGAAKSLARGVAVGAIELVFALLFNAGAIFKALKGGIKGAAKAAVTSVKTTVKATAKSAKELAKIGVKGAKTAFKNGKIMLKGVKSGFAKGAKSLDDIAKRLKNKLRFDKFKIRRQGLRIQLLGHINPWILLADGQLNFHESHNLTRSKPGKGKLKLGEEVIANGIPGIVVGSSKNASKAVKELDDYLPKLQQLVDNNGILRDSILDLYDSLGPKGIRYLAKQGDNEVLAALKAVQLEKLDGGHSVFSHGPHLPHAELKERLKTGWAPENWRAPRRWSPTSGSSKFNSFEDWLDSRDKAFDAIQHNYGFNLRAATPPAPGMPNKFTVTIKHNRSIGKSHLGDNLGRERSHITRNVNPADPTQVRIDPPQTVAPHPSGTPSGTPHPNKHGKLFEDSYKGEIITEPTPGNRKYWLYSNTNYTGKTDIFMTTIIWDGSKWKVVQHFPTPPGGTIDYVVP